MRGHVLSALLVVSSVPPSGVAAEPAPTPFASRRPGEVAVAVAVGGRGPFRFLVDTGSTHSAVTPALAVAVDARPVARAPMSASGGTVECLIVALPPVAVGPAVVAGLAATELPDEGAAALGPGVDGILGQDFLARFSFTIDYRRSHIRWAADEGDGIRLALVPSQDRFVVELPQRGRRALRLVPDSGADTLVLYGEPPAGTLAREWRPGTALLESPAGPRLVRTAIVDGLRVGAATMAGQPAVVLPEAPAAAAPGERADGLLPLHRFARVSFNVAARSLVIHPR